MKIPEKVYIGNALSPETVLRGFLAAAESARCWKEHGIDSCEKNYYNEDGYG